ncbi:MAG: aspartate carbamoyltransferase regulatory subunit, partial [Candidatus Thermoplasmatota archaeon]|nr:aspartate carbamoyltransferase regulatory subunit [Candidatus Thermoplasmatota archaeon]
MRELRVTPIKNGTVIDHIPAGMALKVLKILGITDESSDSTVSVAMRVTSKKSTLKDIVKVEDRELLEKEVDKIALVAPSATINIIQNFNVKQKYKVELPEVAKGILKCGNPN